MKNSMPERRLRLLALLEESLSKGHWKVALRRFLMLRGFHFPVPYELATVCEGLMARCPDRELARMSQSADDFVAMVTAVRAPEPLSALTVDKYDYLHAIAREGSKAVVRQRCLSNVTQATTE